MSGGLEGAAGRCDGGNGPASAPLQLGVVSDHREFWSEISSLGKKAGLALAGPFPTAAAATRLSEARPTLAVIQTAAKDGEALELVGLLGGRSPPLRSVVVTDAVSGAYVAQAVAAGVGGIVLRPLRLPEFVTAIQAAARSGLYLAAGAVRVLSENWATRRVVCCRDTHLTPRELEILRLEATGFLYKEIADKLGLSEHTVNNHLYAIRQKLGVHTAIEAIHHVFCAGCAKFATARPA